ncbi:MAG: response regulator, partial [Sphingomonadaceae bacterium]|nr:response regulator [Sphingomonadaceae bacterium]
GQLTGGIAHDFNNLLTPIMGSLDMLRRRLGPDDARAQRTVDTALQATERAATLVQRLLAFARRQDLQARAVDVAELLAGMDDLLARSLGASVRVVVDVPDELAPARVDPNQLELAILNLSINARDAMPGGGTLTISACESALAAAEPDLKAGRYIRIAVADTGVGMDADTMRRAVEPFFSTKGVGKGTGLGLSMVYGFAAQLGGALRLSGAPGVGTTAELWMPVSDEAAPAGPPGRKAPARAARSATVLLVDDEDLVRMGTADMLTDLGYTVVEARSGPEALGLLDGREADFDLVVTDYLMPEMNGAQLADQVRRIRPGLPLLLVTGYTNLAESAGAALPRLSKPFRQDDLAAQVAELLKR